MLEKKRGFVEKQGTNKIVSLSSFPKTELRGDAIKIKAFNSECRILTIKIIISAFFGANVILTANSVYEKSAPKGFFDNLSEVLKCLKFYGNRLPIDTISAKNLKSKLASLNRSAKTVDMTPEIEVVSDADKGGLIILKGKFKSGREYSETIKPADLTGMQKKAEAENIEEPFKPAKEWYTGKAVSRKVYKAFI